MLSCGSCFPGLCQLCHSISPLWGCSAPGHFWGLHKLCVSILNLYLGKGIYTVCKTHIYEMVADLGGSSATHPPQHRRATCSAVREPGKAATTTASGGNFPDMDGKCHTVTKSYSSPVWPNLGIFPLELCTPGEMPILAYALYGASWEAQSNQLSDTVANPQGSAITRIFYCKLVISIQ